MEEQGTPTRKASKGKIWQAHLRTWRGSGLSRAEYCRQQDLSYHALRYWEKKLSGRQEAVASFVAVPALRVEQAFSGRTDARLKVELGGGYRIEVHDDFSSTTLSRLLATLEGR